MINLSKIIVIFFTVLICYINSGLIKNYSAQERFSFEEGSCPATMHISIQGFLLFSGSDLRFGENQIPSNYEKFIQKLKSWRGLHNNPIAKTDTPDPIKSVVRIITFVTDIFGSKDISFPFNYFW